MKCFQLLGIALVERLFENGEGPALRRAGLFPSRSRSPVAVSGAPSCLRNRIRHKQSPASHMRPAANRRAETVGPQHGGGIDRQVGGLCRCRALRRPVPGATRRLLFFYSDKATATRWKRPARRRAGNLHHFRRGVKPGLSPGAETLHRMRPGGKQPLVTGEMAAPCSKS